MSDNSVLRGAGVMAALLICEAVAYVAYWRAPTGPRFPDAITFAVLALGATNIAILSFFIVGGTTWSRVLATMAAVLTVVAVFGLFWSTARWTAVESASFQSPSAGLWYASMYLMLILPPLTAIAGVFRLSRLVILRHN